MMRAKNIERWRITLAAVGFAMVAQPVEAAPAYCTGGLERMFHEASGLVYVFPTFRNDWVAICNVNANWNGVTPEVCRAWVSEVLSVILTQKAVTMYYADIPSCAAIPYYSNAPAPAYIMVYK
jgi:hypothetical protein